MGVEDKLNSIISELDGLKIKINKQDQKIEKLVTKEDLQEEIKKEVKKIIKPKKEEPFLTWWGQTGLPLTITFLVLIVLVLGLVSLKNCQGTQGYYDREIKTDGR